MTKLSARSLRRCIAGVMPRDIPPSKSYQHLLTLTELEELVEPMDAAELEADLKRFGAP